MKLNIRHDTTYTYDEPMHNGIQYLRLTPRNTPQQKILEWNLSAPGETSQMTDGFGNIVTVMTMDKAAREIDELQHTEVAQQSRHPPGSDWRFRS